MLVLSKRSSLYPQSLVLQGVKRQGDYSVAGGSFGDVWIGKMNEEAVAVKKRTHEAVLWKQISHPNVLTFYGLYTWVQGPRSALCLVPPWAEHGNIIEYLRKTPGADRVPLASRVTSQSYSGSSELYISTYAPNAEAGPLSSGESSELPLDDIQQVDHQAGFTSIPKLTSSLTLLPSDSSWAITKSDILIAYIKYAIPDCKVAIGNDLESCTSPVTIIGKALGKIDNTTKSHMAFITLGVSAMQHPRHEGKLTRT
ncbi:hypothetical protein BDZ94DRAFT_1235011 [Collybia nuda]|uniref:Serine-threonine/tyrosine-protein kinase catalytic domain-containing protein n=1 Tax=Collybia nuda TaxID=64659 RepID=A0A9P5Y751_9AGAR|nr:hypothetical protein BDZ94DRAFT_1235011 [Collybia nuda]